MSMNKQRRTSNINNIVTYDSLGNVTLPANLTVKALTSAGFIKCDANGLFSVDATIYQPLLPTQTGNSGKYLTTDGSTLSWGTVSTANIYNSDGTLTGNRTVTMGSYTLYFGNDIYVNGIRVGRGGGNNQYNTVFGNSAGTLMDASTVSNTVIGARALNSATSGYGNTAVGEQAARIATGSEITIIGAGAGFLLTTGSYNTFVGSNSGNNITTGQYNIAIGRRAGLGITSGSYNVIIGAASGLTSTLSNNIILADGQGNIRIRAFDTGNVTIGSNTDTGLAKLQVTGAIQQTSVTSSLLKTDSNGVLVAATSGTDYVTGNIYTTDGTLTDNRTVNSGGYTLTLNPDLYLSGTIKQVDSSSVQKLRTVTYPTSTYTQNAGIFSEGNITIDGISSKLYTGQFINQNLYNTGAGSASTVVTGYESDIQLAQSGTNARVSIIGYKNILSRGFSSDRSTNGNNQIIGYNLQLGHLYISGNPYTISDLYTANIFAHNTTLYAYGGTINNIYGYYLNLLNSNGGVPQSSQVNNFYGIYVTSTLGGGSTPSATIGNYYGIYLNTPNVGSTGTITNRWGIYAPDSAMKHYLNGTVLIGSATDTGLAKLQITGAIQQTSVTSSLLKVDSNGVLVAATAGTDYSVLPSQTGNSGKYLTTDGSALSWATVSGTNIYNSDGTLTGNRTVNGGGYTLTLNPNITLGGTLYGDITRTINYGEGTYTQNAGIFSENVYSLNGTGGTTRNTELFINTKLTNSGVGSSQSTISSIEVDQNILGTGTNSRINAQGISLYQYRGFTSDISTNANNVQIGFYLNNGHSWSNTSTQIRTGTVTSFWNFAANYAGIIDNLYSYRSQLSATVVGTQKNSTTTNFYAFYSEASIGASSGSTATVTNYYGLYLNTPTVNATGTITNRWGVYSPDSATSHSLQGNVVIGGNTLAGYKLDVQGTGRFTTNLTVGSGIITGANAMQITKSTGAGTFISQVFSYNLLTGNISNVYTGFDSQSNTNSSLSIFNFTHFSASQGVHLSAPTIQIGYTVDAGMTGASTNVAFQGQLPNNTGCYNLYMSGGADNYIFGRVGIGNTPVASAKLSIDSTTSGFLPPRMTNAQRTAISTPAVGLIVYCTDATEGLYIYKSGGWTFIV